MPTGGHPTGRARCAISVFSSSSTRGVAFWWPTSPPPDSAAVAATPCLCVESRVVLWAGMRGVGTSTTTEETVELRPWGVMPPAGMLAARVPVRVPLRVLDERQRTRSAKKSRSRAASAPTPT